MTRRPSDERTLRALHHTGALSGVMLHLREAPTPELWQLLERDTYRDTLPARMTWRCAWENAEVTAWPVATCNGCARRMWDADNNPDPRGAMGDRIPSSLVAREYGAVGEDYALCFLCANEYNTYKAAVRHARTQWTPAPDPTPEPLDPSLFQ